MHGTQGAHPTQKGNIMGTLKEYRARPHWSFSALNSFFNICSLQYAFDRIYKLPKTFTPLPLSFGSAYHRVMEWAGMVRLSGERPMPSEASDLFQSVWERQVKEDNNIKFGEGADAESCAKQGREMVACAVDSMDFDEQVVAVNEAFCVPLTDAFGHSLETPLIGEIDCVVEKEGIKTLTDWKTSARRWPKAKASKDWQPTAFLYGYSQIHGEIPDFRFDVVVKNKTPVFEQHHTQRSEDDFLRFVEMAKLAEKMIAAEHFAPSEQGFYCGGCPHKEACRTWHVDRSRTVLNMAA